MAFSSFVSTPAFGDKKGMYDSSDKSCIESLDSSESDLEKPKSSVQDLLENMRFMSARNGNMNNMNREQIKKNRNLSLIHI